MHHFALASYAARTKFERNKRENDKLSLLSPLESSKLNSLQAVPVAFLEPLLVSFWNRTVSCHCSQYSILKVPWLAPAETAKASPPITGRF